MKNFIRVFITAYLQILGVTMQMKFIQHDNMPLVGTTSFLISILWIMNVNGAVKKSMASKLGYCVGCAFGAMTTIPLYNYIQGLL